MDKFQTLIYFEELVLCIKLLKFPNKIKSKSVFSYISKEVKVEFNYIIEVDERYLSQYSNLL